MDVVISGGGPNGLMLACELRLAGIEVTVLEALPEPSQEPKANGLMGQVVRLLHRRGLHERWTGSAEPPRPNSGYFLFAGMPLNLSLLDESPVYILPEPQRRILQVLAERALELGVEIRRGHSVVGLSQDDSQVTVDVTGPDGDYQLQARYLVGADGAHSVTRKLSGIDFPGVTYERTTLRSAHVSVPDELLDPKTSGLNIPGFGPVWPFIGVRTERGGFSYAPMPGLPPMLATTEWDQPDTDEPMTLDELSESMRRVLGVDVPFGPPEGDGPHLLRRASKRNTRIADRYSGRRVFLIGDAAHVYASGGSGLNLGMQDAANLAWKLAVSLRGNASPELLDTYESERRPAALRMVTHGEATLALLGPGNDVTGLREMFTELLGKREVVQYLADYAAGSDVRYDMGIADAHPLVGFFAPDMDLHTPDGPVQLAELTRTARPLLIDLTADGSLADGVPGVDVVTAKSSTPGLTALLIRPDSYVAWASASPHPDKAELAAVARRWFAA
jgi:2-polyprenyl-6-methoxyphenol hydroxylase-like FAD-dependent oxidoreductase